MIELRTLGGLDLHDSQGRELRVIFAVSKRAALLTYLAIATPRGFHRRDTLLALLWPELDQEHARGALRQALHRIRTSMTDGALLAEGDDGIALDRDAFWCDAVVFEQLLDDGRLEEALALYRGELLEGFHLSGCLEFERWLDDERRRLKDRAAEAARSLAEQAVAAGRTAQAAQWGRHALALSPDDEGVLQRLIALLDRAGDRAGAIREYEAFAKRLREDYEAEPAPETTALIESVRAREQANGGVLPSAPLTKQADDSPVASVRVEARRSWRTRRLAAGAIVALGAIAVVGATVIRNGRDYAPALDPTRVLVDIFQNETGDPSLDHLGRMATDRVTAGLTRTSFVDVVSLGTRLLSREPVVPDTGLLEQTDLQALARANGTGTVVSGSYYLQGDSVHFLAHVTDAGTGEELAALEPVVGAIDAPVAAIEQLRDRVMTTLATLTDPRLAKWMRYASQPPTFEAYQAFVEGVELHTMRMKWGEAVPVYLRAAALDSSFTMPLLWAFIASDWGKSLPAADSLLQTLDRRRRQLAPLDRHLLDHHLAVRRSDGMGRLRAIRRVVDLAPGSWYLFVAGQAALRVNRPREAIEYFKQADPESGLLSGWFIYWDFLTRAYHVIGDHRTELEEARRGRRQFPDRWPREEMRALAALGRVEDVKAAMEEARFVAPWYQVYAGWEIAAELRAHGYPVAASNLVDGAIERFENSSSESTRHPRNRLTYARLLLFAGRLDESRSIFESLLNEDPPLWPSRVRTYLAGILARQGHPEEEILEAVGLSEGEASPLLQAAIAAQQGELERAVRMFSAVTAAWWAFHHNTMFEPLWDYPPFQELIRPKG